MEWSEGFGKVAEACHLPLDMTGYGSDEPITKSASGEWLLAVLQEDRLRLTAIESVLADRSNAS
jgi:hypothetical protein